MTLNTFVAGNSGSVRQLAGSMRDLGAGVEDAATGLHRARSDSEADWEGQAGNAFRVTADSNARDADRLAQLHTDLATALTGFADDLDTVNARMEQARQVATAAKLRVQGTMIFPPDGTTSAHAVPANTPTAPPDQRATAVLYAQQAAYSEAEATVNQARDMERTAHERLQDALKANSTALDQLGQRGTWLQAAASPTTPAAAALAQAATAMDDWAAGATQAAFEQALHGGPAAVHGMWMSLTPDQQLDLIDRYPAMVGNTDGVSAVARDQANRSMLYSQIAALTAAGKPTQKLQQLLDGLDRDGTHRLLLGFKPDANGGRGQAIVANGDPDTADNVLTNVAGTANDLGTFGNDPSQDEIHKIDTIADLARKADPTRSTATIEWVDYDAPQIANPLNMASGEGDALAGQHNLSQFQDGLRVTHQGPPAHNTIVGHSYGSTVVGYAARTGSLPNSNLIFVGSPGVGVDNVNQLHEAPGDVWAAHSPDDGIANVSKSIQAIPYDSGAWNAPEPDEQWFGRDPASPDFGAQQLPVDPGGGHPDYYKLQPDLQNIANIAVGRPPEP